MPGKKKVIFSDRFWHSIILWRKPVNPVWAVFEVRHPLGHHAGAHCVLNPAISVHKFLREKIISGPMHSFLDTFQRYFWSIITKNWTSKDTKKDDSQQFHCMASFYVRVKWRKRASISIYMMIKTTSSDWKKASCPVLICQTEAKAFIAFFSWMLALLGTEMLSTWNMFSLKDNIMIIVIMLN